MNIRMKRAVGAAFTTAAMSALMIAGTVGPADAAKVKTCGTVLVGPGNSGMIETETQTAACNSNSDTGESTEVNNRGGGTPPGRQ